jgi:hypothetical protein
MGGSRTIPPHSGYRRDSDSSERGQRKISRRSMLRNADTQPVMESSASVSLKNQRAIASVTSIVGTLSSCPTTSTPTSFALFLSDGL